MPSLTCAAILKPKETTEFTPIGPAWNCNWSKDGLFLASSHGTPNPCVRIWKQQSSEENDEWILSSTLEGVHERTIRYSSFANSCNTLLASASFDGTVSIWERKMEVWECVAQLEGHENEVKCVIWNSTDTLLAHCGRDKSIWIWECFLVGCSSEANDDFDCIAVLHGHTGDVKCIAFVPSHGQWGDGEEIILSASYDDTIKCWAEDDGDWYCAATLSDIHSSTVWSLSLTSGGTRLVSASDDASLAFWKCYTGFEKKYISQGLEEECTSNDGAWKCVARLQAIHKGPIYSVHCASVHVGHGRIASCGADNRIQVYREVTAGATSDKPQFKLNTFAQLDRDINCIQWHPREGHLLASASDDGFVRIWIYEF